MAEEDDAAMQQELKEAFRLYDKSGEGFIPTSCLREIMRELDEKLTDEQLDEMIEEIDTDGSGTVDFEGNFEDRICSNFSDIFRIHGDDDRGVKKRKIIIILSFRAYSIR